MSRQLTPEQESFLSQQRSWLQNEEEQIRNERRRKPVSRPSLLSRLRQLARTRTRKIVPSPEPLELHDIQITGGRKTRRKNKKRIKK